MDEQGIESSQSVKAHDSTSEPISGHKNYSPLKDEQGIESSQSLKPTIINIVSTVNLACKLDLQSIKLKAPNAEYNPQRHPSVSMRIRAPESKAQINSSGMMVCTGARSESQSKLAASKYATIIRKMGFPAKFKDFKIQEIVGSCDVKFPIRLERLANAHASCSSYNPESFPWLTYQMKEPKIILYIFESGKVYLKGSKMRFTQPLRTYIQCSLNSGKTDNDHCQEQGFLAEKVVYSVSLIELYIITKN